MATSTTFFIFERLSLGPSVQCNVKWKPSNSRSNMKSYLLSLYALLTLTTHSYPAHTKKNGHRHYTQKPYWDFGWHVPRLLLSCWRLFSLNLQTTSEHLQANCLFYFTVSGSSTSIAELYGPRTGKQPSFLSGSLKAVKHSGVGCQSLDRATWPFIVWGQGALWTQLWRCWFLT